MELALGLQKAIALALLIGVGYLLKLKFPTSPHQLAFATQGLKIVILSVSLPATIFLSIISTDLDILTAPLYTLAINLYLMVMGILLVRFLIAPGRRSLRRSVVLMFPSMAPGLTAYPFIDQYLGGDGMAWAALADVGNKIFVLVGLYALAIHWAQELSDVSQKVGQARWRMIVISLLREPVNAAIVVGLALAVAGIHQDQIPFLILDPIQKLAAFTTPLILIFVGVSLKFDVAQLKDILMILLFRSGAGFFFSAVMVMLLAQPSLLVPESIGFALLLAVTPQAGCSLWPLMHATQVNGDIRPTFDTGFILALLTISFPFSIGMIMLMFSAGSFFAFPQHLALAGAVCLALFSLLCWQTRSVSTLAPVQATAVTPMKHDHLSEAAHSAADSHGTRNADRSQEGGSESLVASSPSSRTPRG